MKKIIVVIGIILVVVIAIVATIVINNNENMKVISNINKNSNLPIEYMSEYEKSNLVLQKYEKIDNYMSYDFSDKDISFSYYSYPDDESKYYLGKVSLLTNKYNILGVTAGDNMKKSISKLKEYGFKLEEQENYLIATLKYKKFTIKLESDSYDLEEDDVVINNITLEVESKYLGNREY